MNLPTAASPNPRPNPSDLAIPDGSQVLLAKVAVGLALLTFLIFFPLVGYNFVAYDDDVFVTNNPKIAAGFTWEGVKWACTSTDIDYWRPLSWLSHMLDIELFGAAAGLHHLTSLFIHIAATVMLLLALHRLTGTVWRSAMVAALFAWHPLHVESVAWISERKDVLCGFFWFYTLWAYARYVEQPLAGRYAQVLVGFVFGVMSKPMIVTLPCVLLLLDYWPLRRVNPVNLAWWRHPGWRTEFAATWLVLKEKLPLFAIVLALSLSTMTAQREVGTMSENIPLYVKLVRVSQAYTIYLRQTFWPADLCLLNPFTPEAPSWKWAGVVLLCVGLTVRFLSSGRRFPFLPVGWLWFVGVLVPMIGLVQVGEQAHADRYTYVPLVGLFLLLVWGAVAVAENRPWLNRWGPGAAVLVLLACAVSTRLQLRYWENTEQAFRRSLEVHPRNVSAANNLAADLMLTTRSAEAIPILERAIAIDRRPGMVWNLGLCYFNQGEYARAQAMISEAFSREKNPRDIAEWLRLMHDTSARAPETNRVWPLKMNALALAALKDYAGATVELTEALRLAPLDSDARTDKAAYLAAAGRDDEALALLQETVQLNPSHALARSNLGGLLARKGRAEEALLHFRAALELAPANPDTRHNFALTLARTHRPLEARDQFEEVLRRKPNHLSATQQLAWLLATRSECRDAPRALILAKVALTARASAPTLDVAAAATAANGDYEGACQLATQAIQLAREAKLSTLEESIRARLQLYRAGQAYTQPVTNPGQ